MALNAGGGQNASINRFLNRMKYAFGEVASDITTATTSDIVVLFDASDDYAPKYGDASNMFELLGITATAAEINGAADVGSRIVQIPDETTYTVLAANSGKTHIVPELTGNITISLPTAAAGLEYTFIMGGVATEGQNWIFDTLQAANFYLGGLQHLDSDEPGSGSTLVPVYPNGSSNAVMTIITPQAGTRVHIICDGTEWYVNGVVFSATAPTFGDT